MKRVKSLIATLTTALLVSAAFAQASLPLTEAEVRKVDKDNGKITLKHGEIKNLDMPPMSMVFQVKNPALLDKVKTGDKVSVTIDRINGAFTVLSIEPRP
jgi:Cu(I)/Ag(I) efflux system protein CusF